MIVMDPKRLQADIDLTAAWLKAVGEHESGLSPPFRSVDQLVGAARLYLAMIPKPVEPQWRVVLWRTEGVKEVYTRETFEESLDLIRTYLGQGYTRAEIEPPLRVRVW
jgi:hypothetical protein